MNDKKKNIIEKKTIIVDNEIKKIEEELSDMSDYEEENDEGEDDGKVGEEEIKGKRKLRIEASGENTTKKSKMSSKWPILSTLQEAYRELTLKEGVALP